MSKTIHVRQRPDKYWERQVSLPNGMANPAWMQMTGSRGSSITMIRHRFNADDDVIDVTPSTQANVTVKAVAIEADGRRSNTTMVMSRRLYDSMTAAIQRCIEEDKRGNHQ